jgi:predicted transcriptional regulator of viral defense system
MQLLFDVFLRYHGFRSGDAIRVHVVVPWQRNDGRGDFGVSVRIDPEVLMGQEDGVVPTRDEAQAAEQALAWVLLALLRHADTLLLKCAIFW